jgi:hypothetical protein
MMSNPDDHFRPPSPQPPVIPEVEPRPASRGETIRDLLQGSGALQIPDGLRQCVGLRDDG